MPALWICVVDLDFGTAEELWVRRGPLREEERELDRIPGVGGTDGHCKYERLCSGRRCRM